MSVKYVDPKPPKPPGGTGVSNDSQPELKKNWIKQFIEWLKSWKNMIG